MSPLLLAYAAVAAALLSGVVALAADRFPAALRRGSFTLLGICGLAAVAGGGEALLTGQRSTAQLPFGLPWLNWHLRLDPLSGFFMAIIGIAVVAISFYGPGYVREFERTVHAHGTAPADVEPHTHPRQSLAALGLFTGIFVAGMLAVLLADDAFVFMIAWEVMSVSSYLLVAYQHHNPANRHAAFLYLLLAHVGALVILLAFGVLAGFGGGFTFDAMRAAHLTPVWASIAFALALFGFGMKAGMVPLHVWLPEAHPVAPSHISALMSGVMIKVAIYGLIRFTFDLLGQIQWSWGLATLAIGTATALLGVLYALTQNDFKRLLAYSSVENVGIILMGLGLSMIFVATGHPALAVVALLAALYHSLNHAVFKTLLFLGAGAVLYRTHERDLDRMGGLIRRMPATALFMLIGCLSIAALPPFNGFVSEWLTLQAALQVPVLASGVLRSIIPIAAALLALTTALAAATFVKVYGVAFLGQARTRHVAHAREVGLGMRAAMALLALLCVVLGVVPTLVIRLIEPITQDLLRLRPAAATVRGWLWLTPVSPHVASYSAPLVVAAMAFTFLAGYLLLHRRGRSARRSQPWDCGFGGLSARMQYTSTAFAQPIRKVFAPVWQIDERVEKVQTSPTRFVSMRHHLHVGDWSWSAAYQPIGHLVLAAARRVGRIQTGSIRVYLAYSFFTLLLLLWLIT
ncbi:MAG: hydrogenase 4 subunit B [Gammaproteobacteria bacterium]|nr:hydrogenase 4 subunit B [Gammaproteobacteria bacterium]